MKTDLFSTNDNRLQNAGVHVREFYSLNHEISLKFNDFVSFIKFMLSRFEKKYEFINVPYFYFLWDEYYRKNK